MLVRVLVGIAVALGLAGCSRAPSGACAELRYDAGGQPPGHPKDKYLPCARAIIDSLERLDTALRPTLTAQKPDFRPAVAEFRTLRELLRQAGGRDAMNTPWGEVLVNDMNSQIFLAYAYYDSLVTSSAFYRKPMFSERDLDNTREHTSKARVLANTLR